MKNKKIYYVLLITVCAVLFTTLIGAVGIITTVNMSKENALNELRLESLEFCYEFDAKISSIEQAVHTMEAMAIYHLDDFERFKEDPDYVDTYTKGMDKRIRYIAEQTQGALSVYIRYNKEIASPTSGCFLVRDDGTGILTEYPVTDLSASEDLNTAWYDIPVAMGKPVWIAPYDNNYINRNMISYVTPYYVDEELVGVIGMDIQYEYIEEMISEIKTHDSGFAFLTDEEGNVIVHKDYELYDAAFDSEEILRLQEEARNEISAKPAFRGDTYVFTRTKNGMILCLAVPNKEIYKASNKLFFSVLFIEIAAILVIVLISTLIIRKLYLLSEVDELTGAYNRKYFIRFYQELKRDDIDTYMLFIFDIDNFKNINDSYGHNAGDKAIFDVAKLAGEFIGKNGIVARWGGDEFIGVIKKEYAVRSLNEFRKVLEERTDETYGRITISAGIAELGIAPELSEVCELVDKALYFSKRNGRNRVTEYTPEIIAWNQ